jgi:crotonobetainyl-CoA:carnitine CoA-transferase CaiB-like acyl-CoA transferase
MTTTLRILDASVNSVAASSATGVLAAMGFEVWKLEDALEGDPLRRRGPRVGEVDGTGLVFALASRGKRWVGLAAAVAPLFEQARARLAQAADIVVVSDPVTADALGDHAPVVSVTPFGLTGPRRGWRASSTSVYHSSGAGYVTPRAPAEGADQTPPPQAPWGEVASYFGGLYVAVAALATTLTTRQNGVIDLSLQECLLPLLRRETGAWLYDSYLASRSERLWRVAPSAFYATADSYVYVNVVEDKQWLRLCELMGRADLSADPRFETAEARFEHLADLDANLRPWFASQAASEVFAQCGAAGIPVGHAMAPDELLRCEQLLARDAFTSGGGLGPSPVLPIRQVGTQVPAPPVWDAPLPGRDSEAVLSDAGWSAEELADLVGAGAVLRGASGHTSTGLQGARL